MYPELFRIGSFPVTTYGIFLAAGMLLALFVASRLGARDGLPRERIYDLGLWTLIGGLIGSKILMYFVEDNVHVFSLDFLRSGGVYYGGFIGAFLALAVLIRFYKMPFWKVTDAFAPALALGQALGRQGCFAAGSCSGKPTDPAWGVHSSEAGMKYGRAIYGPGGEFLHLHPTQLYTELPMLLVFDCVLLIAIKVRRADFHRLRHNLRAWRFSIEFVRDDPRGDLFGLTSMTGLSTSQLISLLVAAGAIIFMIVRLHGAKAKKEIARETR